MTEATRDLLTPDGIQFVTDYHLATLSTIGRDGRIHVVPVGFSLQDGLVRVITSRSSQKVLNVRRDSRATVSQFEGARWITFSGEARVLEDAESVQLAVDLYTARYRAPRVNPERVVIVIEVQSAMGSAGVLAARGPSN